MSTYLWSGQAAVIVGSAAFAALFLPLVVWHYRRYGAGDPRRLLGSFAVAVYAAALVTYTLLPLPPRAESWCAQNAVTTVQLVPFSFVRDIAHDTAGLPLRAALTHGTVLQVVFNVLLFVPWGVLVRRWAHRSTAVAVVSGLAASVLIETTQFTALWGLYPCRYRWPDMDDVLTNTTGALIGALVAPAVLWWMPKARELAAARGIPRPVTVVRRWLGMAVDLALWGLVWGVVVAVVLIAREVMGLGNQPLDGVTINTVGLVLGWLVVCLWPAWSGSGATAGESAVWLTPVWYDGPGRRGAPSYGTRLQRVARAGLLPGIVVLGLSTPTLLGVLAFVLPPAEVVSVPFTRGRRALSAVLLGAELVDSRSLPVEAPRVPLAVSSRSGSPAA